MSAISDGEINPYEAPRTDPVPAAGSRAFREGTATSLLMMVAGTFYCVASFYILLGHGLAALLNNYRQLGALSVGFMAFYGCAGGLTALLHGSFLMYGRPRQHLAGLYAIGVAIIFAVVAVGVLEVAA